jgi:eukaryotic-like serine/threonine-protein kinase
MLETVRVGGVLAGRYRIEALLGTGSVALVFQAFDETQKRRVALKILHRQLCTHPDAKRRFRREARAASALEHPNIALVYEYGQTEDLSPFLAMECIEGRVLSSVLRATGPLSVSRSVGILLQIGEALRAAHGAGVIHRDLKPANVMLSPGPALQDRVKVLDFGLAKFVTAETVSSLSGKGFIFGTPEYMSPEQISGEDIDTRTDLYSVGIIAHELLAGEIPFKGTVAEVMIEHLSREPPPLPPTAGGQAITDGLRRLVRSCLAKKPADRLPDAEHLVSALRSLRL